MKYVLMLGIDADLVDLSHAPPGVTRESIVTGVNASVAKLNELGFHAENLWIDSGACSDCRSDRGRCCSGSVCVCQMAWTPADRNDPR